jgi:hypothetical protein
LTAALVLCVARAAFGGQFDPKALFSQPTPLMDPTGKPVTTGRAQGCPAVADFNNDGKMDFILGAKESMDTATGGVWLIPNVGTHDKPLMDWHNAVRVQTKDGPVRIGCG